MIGSGCVFGFARSCSTTSKPLSWGSFKSRIIRSGSFSCARSTAVLPSYARITLKPACCKNRPRISTINGSSSTSNTVRTSATPASSRRAIASQRRTREASVTSSADNRTKRSLSCSKYVRTTGSFSAQADALTMLSNSSTVGSGISGEISNAYGNNSVAFWSASEVLDAVVTA